MPERDFNDDALFRVSMNVLKWVDVSSTFNAISILYSRDHLARFFGNSR